MTPPHPRRSAFPGPGRRRGTGTRTLIAVIDSLSPSARRLLRRPRPRWRGRLHRWAALATIPAGVVLVATADGMRGRLALAVFFTGAAVMLGTSAVVHARDWSAETVETLVRADHTAIFVMFPTSATPVALLALEPPVSWWLLGLVWGGALVGIVAEWTPWHPPAGVMNAVYLGLGWSVLVFVPQMVRALDAGQLALLFGGGAAYTGGALVVGARRPDPAPEVFGYHEIWHVCVVVAVALHAALAVSLAAPAI